MNLLTKTQVAAMFQVSPRTIDRWRSLWHAKGIDVGEICIRNTVRFRQDAIDRLINNKRLWLR